VKATVSPEQFYTTTETKPRVDSVPYPPNEVQLVNLPMHLTVSRLVAITITGEVIPDQLQISY
jgi:hypothetical protein